MKSSAPDRPAASTSLRQRAAQALAIAGGGAQTLALAVSGGSDSTALLALAADHVRTIGNLRLVAITIDHGLRPEAAEEARHVKCVSERLGVAHETLTWTRTPALPADQTMVGQAEARRARHALLGAWASRNRIDRIALGHTRDDRIETFLMRARQGSGWYGLAGPMPSSPSPVWPEGDGLTLVRPLLAFGREELRDDLRARGLDWIEDPSNANDRFERVRMRKLSARISPERRDSIVAIMDRLAELRTSVATEAHGLLADLETPSGGGRAIALAARESVSAEAWRRFLEAMVMTAGGGDARPRTDALARLADRIGAAEPALASGTTLGGARIRIRNGVLLTFETAPPRRRAPPPEPAIWTRAERLLAPADLRLLAI